MKAFTFTLPHRMVSFFLPVTAAFSVSLAREHTICYFVGGDAVGGASIIGSIPTHSVLRSIHAQRERAQRAWLYLFILSILQRAQRYLYLLYATYICI